MKSILFAFVVMMGAFSGVIFCHVPAAAAEYKCTSDERYHINLGLDFLKEAKAYEARDETDLANADWENLGHQVELINSDMASCDNRAMLRDFYLLSAWDSFKTFMSTMASGNESAALDLLSATNAELAGLHLNGGATYYSSDYRLLKHFTKLYYESDHKKYCSPDLNLVGCEE